MSNSKKIFAALMLTALTFVFVGGAGLGQRQNKAHAEQAPVHVSSLFYPLGIEGMSKGNERAVQATGTPLPAYLAEQENKGAMLYMNKYIHNNTNTPPSALQTKPFAIADNTEGDLLVRLRPTPTENKYKTMLKGKGNGGADIDAITAYADTKYWPTVRNITVTVRDALYPDNYFEMYCSWRDGENSTYDFGNLSVRGDNQSWGGERGDGNLRTGQALGGALVPVSFWGNLEDWIEVYYDAAGNKLYATMTTGKKLLRDFGKSYAGKDEAVWSGFRSGFVTVDVQFNGGTATDYVMLATHIDGLNLETDANGNIKQTAAEQYNNKPSSFKMGFSGGSFDQGLTSYPLPVLSKSNLLVSHLPAAELTAEYTVNITDSAGADVTAATVTGLDGGKWHTDAVFTPQHVGKYTFRYTKGTEVLEAEFTVNVNPPLSGLLETDDNISITYDKSPPAFMTGSTGLGLNISDEATLTIKNPVKLSSLNASTPIISYLVTPNKKGQATDSEELKTIIVTLTDASNPDNYIRIKNSASALDVNNSFVNAAAAGQVYGGVKQNHGGVYASEKDRYGTAIAPEFSGRQSIVAKLYYYDNKVFAGQDLYTTGDVMVRDFSDKSHLLQGETLFGGFQSDYAYITVTFGDISQETGVILYSIGGQALGREFISDTTAPDIEIESAFFQPRQPDGEVGMTYRLPQISTSDFVSGNVDENLTAKVFSGYGTADESEVPVSDGAFIPGTAGEYAIVLSAFDSSINESIKVIPITVHNKLGNINIQMSYELPSSVEVGQKIVLPSVTVMGGSGNYVLEIAVTKTSGEVVQAGAELVFDRQGMHTVTYKVTDWMTVKTFTRVIKAVYGAEMSVVMEDAVVPKAIVKGKTLALNMVKAYDNVSFIPYATPAPVGIYISENGGEFVKLGAGFTYKPAAQNGYLTVEYRTAAILDSNIGLIKSYRVQIINPSTMGDFFYAPDGNIAVNYQLPAGGFDKEAFFSTNVNGAWMQFVNKLPASNFSIALTNPELKQFGRLTVRLTDSADASKSVSINITHYQGLQSRLAVPGVEPGYLIDGSLNNNSEITFKYTGGLSLLTASGGVIGAIPYYDSGAAFDGFSSGLIYMDIIFEGIPSGGGAGLKINKLCNQPALYEEINTFIKPILALEYTVDSYHNLGDTIILPKAFTADLLDSDTVSRVSVTAPDGTAVISGAAASQNHALRLTQYGVYAVAYMGENSSGVTAPRIIYLTVYDTISPVLEFDGSVMTDYAVGDNLKLIPVQATDNITPVGDMQVKVYLIDSLYRIIPVGADGYEFAAAGNYTLRYFVEDAAKNYVIRDFALKVQ